MKIEVRGSIEQLMDEEEWSFGAEMGRCKNTSRTAYSEFH
jgi:hypothetical protein